MSGRKASEVNSLLRNAVKTRTNSMSILEDIYNKLHKNIQAANSKAQELKGYVESKDYEICDEARKEFSKNAEDLQAEIVRLRDKVNTLSFTIDDKEYSSLRNEYKKVDDEAEIVRREVKEKIKSQGRNDPWYCDAEFAHARQVQDKYKELADKAKRLNNSMSGSTSSVNSDMCAMDENKKQAIKLKEMVSALNRKAKDLVKLRADASNARDEIRKELKDIDSDIAKKFLSAEYERTSQEIQKYLQLSDEDVVKAFTKMTSEITEFVNSLQARYAEYLEKQSIVRGKIEAVEERISNKAYSNPEDEFKQGNREMFSLVEFIDKYGDSKQIKEIHDELSRCRKFFQNDDFEEANNSVDILMGLVNKAANNASLIHENRMKTIINMLTIKKAMLELRYDVEVRKNESSDDGYCISCTDGDESIRFDKVTVINDGQPIITIDHKEATNGTCAASWYEIRQKLSEEGLFIEDITKNGKSIHIANSKRMSGNVDLSLKSNG